MSWRSLNDKRMDGESEDHMFNRLNEMYQRKMHPLVAAIEAQKMVEEDRNAASG